jgi:hypothetical protein
VNLAKADSKEPAFFISIHAVVAPADMIAAADFAMLRLKITSKKW